jgi:hypothetical protein
MDSGQSLSSRFAWLDFFRDVLGYEALLPPDLTVRGGVAFRLNELAAFSHCSSNIPRFRPSDKVLSALDYETEVSYGEVPTRDCLHDWYNGLVWLLFPASRLKINGIHLTESLDRKSGNGRSSRRNALTLFDESGAILLTEHEEFVRAFRDHDWDFLFQVKRELWHRGAKLILFGHGLLESLHVRPHKGLCAKVFAFSSTSFEQREDLDALLAAQLDDLDSARLLMPLPVMGVPGWFRQNEVPGFYSDCSVFRPKPTR